MRLLGIRPSTLLAGLVFRDDDRWESINGYDVRSPAGFLEPYANTRNTKEVHVDVTRPHPVPFSAAVTEVSSMPSGSR